MKQKYITILLYITDNNKNKRIGTKLYSRDKKLVKIINYLPNRLVIFKPNKYSYHNMSGCLAENELRFSIQTNYLNKITKYKNKKNILFKKSTKNFFLFLKIKKNFIKFFLFVFSLFLIYSIYFFKNILSSF